MLRHYIEDTRPNQVAALSEKPEKLRWEVSIRAKAFFAFGDDLDNDELGAVVGVGTFNGTMVRRSRLTSG